MRLTPGTIAGVTRRSALGALAASAVGFALLGPRPRKARTDGRVVLDYWEKWTGHEAVAMQRVVDEFNASQSRSFVRYFSMGGIDQKALVAIAGGDPPDILGMGNFSIPPYAQSNALVPLDDYAASAGIRPDAYAPAIWPMLTHAGRLWGVVNTCGALALFYNRTLFRESGLDPDRPPTTIQELDRCARALERTDDRPGLGGREITRAGFLHAEPDWWSWIWGYPFGGSLYDAQRDLALADSPQNIEAYRWVASYPRLMGVDRLLRFQSGFGFYGTAENPFLAGKVAMTMQGPWLANMIARYKPEMEYAVTPMPVTGTLLDESAPVGLLDSDVLVIPRGARHPDLSFEFLAYTQRQEVVEFLSSAHCKNSPLARRSDAFVRDHPNRFVEVHSAVASSPRAFIFPRTRTWEQYVGEFNAAMQRIWSLREEPAPALTRVQRAAQANLDLAADQARRRAAVGAR